MTSHYYSFNEYCKERFGEKVYRLSINGGMSCPNRDGTLGTTGCAFCSTGGSGDFAADAKLSITEQLSFAKKLISKKTSCQKFIAYFQAYTNTYAPISYLRETFTEAIQDPQVCGLSIATRSDCLPDDVILLLQELNEIKPVWVEIGLQTIHDRTLKAMHCGTSFAGFDEAQKKLQKAGIPLIVHLILGLPGETIDEMKQSVSYVASIHAFGIKLQLLHILKNTSLAEMYEQHPFPVFSLESYCDLIGDCIELLPEEMVICRLTGDGPKNLLIAPTWSADKKRVLNTLNRRLDERQIQQGKEYHRG